MAVVSFDDPLSFRFRGGRLSLNLVATVGWRDSSSPVERLGDGRRLAVWYEEAGLTETAVSVSPKELADVRQLREAIWECAVACLESAPLPSQALKIINRLARQAPPAPQLDAEGRLLVPKPEAFERVGLLARDAVSVLGRESSRLKRCARPDCTLLFVDESRAGRRRWCSMEACGNRAKTRTYRLKERA